MQKVKLSIQSEQTRWRMWFWTVCKLFVLYSMLRSLHSGLASDALVCLLVGIGVAAPYIAECFGYRTSDALFVSALDKGRHPAFIHAAMASLPGKKSVHAQAE